MDQYRDLFAFGSEDEMLSELKEWFEKQKTVLDINFEYDFPFKQEPIETQEYINNPITELNNNLECDFLIKQEPSEFQECDENQITVLDYNFEWDFSMKQEPKEQENMEIKEEINDDFDYHDRYGNKDSSPLSEYDEENQEISELTEFVENLEASELIEFVENQEASELIEYVENQETELNGEDPTRNSASDDSRPMDPTDGTNEDQPIPATCANSNDHNDKSKNNSSAGIKIPLWQLFHELLDNPGRYGHCIRWVDRSQGVFKIEDSVRVARFWGSIKNCPTMDYDKLSSFMDRYYKNKIIRMATGDEFSQQVFQFSPRYRE
ncbi:hypothetical protein TKK_0004274 [Trichogramma kaykai]|uniref:ETS domain-containing protein n=1 Tax=Trichogramma kaykai TaxID=54128 RepID=A0ABD2XKI9_9HYME